ncbi:S1C family serine protease [Actinocorallia populi]|uniref:S1C family serine protease n=1 Tax=Actinocorallia populi TaxID=2079200 RepID=UPI000D094BC3|nr:trypsin-like peptidase domain-containing protein [Actinocorallia populi]
MGRREFCAAVLAAVLLAGCSGGGGDQRATTAGTTAPPAGDTSALTGLEDAYVRIVASVLPSVVQINTDQGEGSGVVYDGEGHIVTNAHVVAGARSLEVVPSSGGSPQRARLVGAFEAGDLAVVKVEGANLRPARFGDSTGLKVGQIVLAMGSPLGLSGSVTNGIISATGRTVTSQRQGAFPGATISDAVQTSAAINPGNSGGALVTLDGEVVGIPTLAAGTGSGDLAAGIGFAIPGDTVRTIVPQLISSGRVTNTGRAALNVTIAQTFDNATGEPGGVAIVSVGEGGAAAEAGLREGDVIVEIAGRATPTTTALAEVLADLKVGQTVPVKVRRDGREQTVQVKLGELPGD